MDVKCERCNTEYEFDDALVSGRGTTVKCTNCGHKFKIRRSDGDFSEDFWNVTTGDGRTLVFTSLRELQRAIQGYLVERNDRLSRGGLPPKAIGQIPELAPFFDQREAAKRNQQSGRSMKTQDGLGPAAAAALNATGNRPRQATKPEFPAPPPNHPSEVAPTKATLIGTGPVTNEPAILPAPPPIRARAPSIPPPLPPPRGRAPSVPPATERQPAPPRTSLPPPVPPPRQTTMPITRPTTPPPVPQPRTSAFPPLPQGATSQAAPGAEGAPAPVREKPPSGTHSPAAAPPAHAPASSGGIPATPPPRPADDAAPAPVRASATPSNPPSDASSPLPPRMHRSLLSEIGEERDRARGPSASMPDGPPSRRGVGGFIVAAVVLGCLLLLGAVWAQKNLGATLGGKPRAPAPAVDPRVATFLTNGEKALADGNLDLAKESFDKASALSEKDPHVLLGLARLAAVRADVLWLKSRLLPADVAADEHRVTRDGLNDLAAGARKAADDGLLVAEDDPAALRAKIDASRISGDRDGARALVGRISASSAGRVPDPETAYVLAALDLAEVEPLWSTVIERLKIASAAETGPGRARAALVFALARSGDVDGATAELDRLVALPKAHPLLPLLRAHVDRARGSAKLDAGAGDAAALEIRDAGKGRRAAGGGGGGGGDARDLVAQAEKARAKGDYEKAKTLFSQAVDRSPNDSEALTGLAAIAYAQRDLDGARAAYKRVIAINPNYMPAVVGLADVEWDSGDKGTATKMYKDIVDRFPEGAYPGRVKIRAEGGG